MVTVGGALYFVVDAGTDGPAVWKTDGTAAGTSLVWASGSSQVGPGSLYAFDGAVYFPEVALASGVQAGGVYKSDGTPAGTVRLSDAAGAWGFTAAAGRLFFAAVPAGSQSAQSELYVTDGTPAGTRLVDPALSLSVFDGMLPVGDLLYFTAYGPQGAQLWQTDGTNTVAADPAEIANGWTPDRLLGDAAGGVVFAATDVAHGSELWDLPVATPPATASFVKSDSSTEGNWTGTYGSDGYAIANGATSLPSYVQLATGGASTWTWQQPSDGDSRSLQSSPGSSIRLAACDYSDTSFTYDLNLTDGQAHQVALYALNWDSWSYRNETITITDANTGAVLDSRSLTNFNNGQWLVWNLSGHVKIMVTNNGGLNAVASGLFFGPTPTAASFVRADTATQGAWTGVYGADGYSIINGATNLPAYAQLTTSGASTWTWATASSTTDNRDLQTGPGDASRIAACDYSDTSFTYDLNLTDGKAHQVALYAVNWDWWSYRNETITITDANTGAVLDSRNLTNFNNGQWLVWNISGHVKITVTNNGGLNAVASSIFFG
jgi:ELWxxDGT repeat protein